MVWKGFEPGIYQDWEDAKLQTEGYPQAKFKSFKTAEEAVAAFRAGLKDDSKDLGALLANASCHTAQPAAPGQGQETAGHRPEGSVNQSWRQFPEIDPDGWAVDASCLGNPGVMEYRCVSLKTGKEVFHMGPLAQGTNNIGEFLGIVHAMALMAKDHRWHTLYSDSTIAIGWAKKGMPRTTLTRNPANERIFELLGRAVIWLRNHRPECQLVKWNTEVWGEIPADFDRK